MARYYRRRYRTIIRAPKKKWASNIKAIAMITSGSDMQQYSTITLVENSSEASTPTPVILKTGNIKVQGDFRVTTPASGGNATVSLYAVFVPQGFSVTSYSEADALIKGHPEWIMAWKFLGANANESATTLTTQNYDSFSFSSRLKRNLNSGDSVILICLATGTYITTVDVQGMAQCWTCSN